MEQLIAALERDAAAEVQQNLDRARNEAAALLEGCHDELAQRLDDELQRHEQSLRVQTALAVAEARRAGRSEVLRARDVLLGRVRAAVDAGLAVLDQDPGYRAGLAAELEEALGYLAEGPAEVCCRPSLAAPLAAAAAGLERAELSVREDAALATGFLVRATDGHAEVDARLTTRVERMWPELALVVLAVIDQRGWWRGAAHE